MTSSKAVAFIVGLALGVALARTPAVEAVEQALMFGSFNNAAKAVQVDTNGYVKVVIH